MAGKHQSSILRTNDFQLTISCWDVYLAKRRLLMEDQIRWQWRLASEQPAARYMGAVEQYRCPNL